MFNSPTIVNGGSFIQKNQTVNLDSKGGFERLREATSLAAFHNSSERSDLPRCHPGTRTTVLANIKSWIQDEEFGSTKTSASKPPILWISGSAYCGKTTVAETITEHCHENGTLLASFAFSRNDSTRNHGQTFVPTIAYQIARQYPPVKEAILAAIDSDPLILTQSLEAQFIALFVAPLRSFFGSQSLELPGHSSNLITVVDGLDECQNTKTQRNILRLFSRPNNLPPKLRFIFTSRPKEEIASFMHGPIMKGAFTHLVLYNASDSDMALLLKVYFSEIKDTHRNRIYIPPEWPTQSIFDQLLQSLQGRFIYASAVLEYVASSRHQPVRRLGEVLGVGSDESQFTGLDTVYTYILSRVDDLSGLLRVLAAAFLEFGMADNLRVLEEFLGIGTGEVSRLLCDLDPLVSCQASLDQEEGSLRPWHLPLKYFLMDEKRSGHLFLQPQSRLVEYARLCFKHLERKQFLNYDYLTPDMLVTFATHFCVMIQKPSRELCDDIFQFSLQDAFETSPHNDLVDLVASFIRALRADWKDWKGTDWLYQRQRRLFENFISKQLCDYYKDPDLTLLVAGMGSGLGESVLRHSIQSIPEQVYPFHLSDASRNRDRSRLHILQFFSSPPRGSYEYRRLLCEGITDPERTGTNALNGHRYATAARVCLQSLCEGQDRYANQSWAMLFIRLELLAKLLKKADTSDELMEYMGGEIKFAPVVWTTFPDEAKSAWDIVEGMQRSYSKKRFVVMDVGSAAMVFPMALFGIGVRVAPRRR